MTDLPADVRERYRDLARQRRWPAGTESTFLEEARWFRDLDEGPAPRSYYEGAADEPGLAGTRWLWETAVVADEIIAVKQIEVPPDGIARCYWWPHLGHDLGFLTDQPLNPDSWQLRTVDRGIFYQFWHSPGR
jgi:hypothetical protein